MLLVITIMLTVTLMSARQKLQNYRGNVKVQIKLCFPQDNGRQIENKQLKTMQAVSRKQLKKSTFFQKTFFFIHNSVQLTYLSLKRAKFRPVNNLWCFLWVHPTHIFYKVMTHNNWVVPSLKLIYFITSYKKSIPQNFQLHKVVNQQSQCYRYNHYRLPLTATDLAINCV